MSPTPDNLRYERKFVLADASLAGALQLLRLHPALFREIHPERWVNNVYLDTPGHRDYFEHIHGTAHRSKLRLRWYGPRQGEILDLRLERKFKQGLLGGKEVHSLPTLTVNGSLPGHELDALFAGAELPDSTRARLIGRTPALFNRYLRRYFASADGRFRFTVDHELQFGRLLPGDGLIRPVTTPDSPLILELKYGPAQANQAPPVTNALGLRLTRCSKYVRGIETLRTG